MAPSMRAFAESVDLRFFIRKQVERLG